MKSNSFNMLKIFKSGVIQIQLGRRVINSTTATVERCYSDDSKSLKKTEENKEKVENVEEFKENKSLEKPEESSRLSFRQIFNAVRLGHITVWDEKSAVKRLLKSKSGFRNVENVTDFIKKIQNLNSLPSSPKEFLFYLRNRRITRNLLSQQYLPERVRVLKPDLAACHFILGRRGSVKFLNHTHWKGIKGVNTDIPICYVPGHYIEAIDAEGTGLCYEGFSNLADLPFLSWLSLKGLSDIDDWCLDWISAEYHSSLTHLDISDCKNVTYRGLSCFYRFECLRTLIVSGIQETNEFKLACIMLQEIKPDLEIKGIDLSVPKKIEPVKVEEVQKSATV